MKKMLVLCLLCLSLFVVGCGATRYVVMQQPVAALTGTNTTQSVVYVAPQQIVTQPPLVYTSYPEYYPKYYYQPLIRFGWSWEPRYYSGYHHYGGHYGGYRGGSHHYGYGGHRRR